MEKNGGRVLSEIPVMRLLFFSTILVVGTAIYTPSRSAELLPAHAIVDSIVIIKQKRELFVYQKHQLLKIYRIALGAQPKGAKQYKGDMRTPEGMYFINGKNPKSTCHKSLGISYPSVKDREYAQSIGKDPGGDIKIHGLPNGQGYIGAAHTLKDWTWGCIAITDEEIDELYDHVKVGASVNILP